MGCRELQLSDYFRMIRPGQRTDARVQRPGGMTCPLADLSDRSDLPRGISTQTAYAYDLLGRLATVTDANGTTAYSYTKVGSRESVALPNGAKTIYQYDDLNRLLDLSNFNSSDNLISSYTYTLAPKGRRTAVAESTGEGPSHSIRNIAYTYDNLNRLTKEVSECADNADLAYTDEYTYDLVDNRLSKCSLGVSPENISYSYNANDQLISETSSTKGLTEYQYDTNGSLIFKANQAQDEVYSYTYNLNNRLSSATITRMEGPSLVDISSNYLYNQSGIRVLANTSTKVDGGPAEVKATVYLTDPAGILGTVTGGNAVFILCLAVMPDSFGMRLLSSVALYCAGGGTTPAHGFTTPALDNFTLG